MLFLPLVLAVVLAEPLSVHTLRTPDSGIQPQVAVGTDGTVHLLYYKGGPASGDLFYTSRPAGADTFNPAIKVNSIPGSACAAGNIRGGQIALGKAGRVHIAWNGSAKAADSLAKDGRSTHAGTPMLYTRLSGTAFEPERDAMTSTINLDGGGSIAADAAGHVYIVWHAALPETASEGEPARRVYIASSADEGATFTAESPVRLAEQPGACGCCGLRAFASPDGSLSILFRSAGEKVHRDVHLLRSTDHGATFTDTTIDTWRLNACPMTTASIVQGPSGPILAWESRRQVFWASATDLKPASPAGDAERRYPSVAVNSKGEVLLVWTEGMTWGQGGSVHWQVFDASSKPLAAEGKQDGVPAWSLIAAFAEPDGAFTIVY